MYVTGLAAWAASSGMKLSWPAARKISTSSAVRPRRDRADPKVAQHLIDFAGKCVESGASAITPVILVSPSAENTGKPKAGSRRLTGGRYWSQFSLARRVAFPGS